MNNNQFLQTILNMNGTATDPVSRQRGGGIGNEMINLNPTVNRSPTAALSPEEDAEYSAAWAKVVGN